MSHLIHCNVGTGILLYILDSGSGGELNKTAWARNREEKERKEKEEREQKAREAEKEGVAESYTSKIAPNTAFQIRNRFLSRVGTKASSLCPFRTVCDCLLSSLLSFRCQIMSTFLRTLLPPVMPM